MNEKRYCRRPTCTRLALKWVDLCEQHHEQEKRLGLRGLTDPGPMRRHIAMLREADWTMADIAKTAGVANSFITKHVDGVPARVNAAQARLVLAVKVDDPKPYTFNVTRDATGFIRRVRAMSCMGWRLSDIGGRLGRKAQAIADACAAGRVSRELHDKMVALYEELSAVPGPSKHAATKAQRKGWVPPLGWDDIDNDPEPVAAAEQAELIDEVAVQRAIHSGDGRSLTDAEKEEVVRQLLAKGSTRTEAARVVHWSFYRTDKVAA